MQQDKITSEVLAEIAKMDRDLRQLTMRARWVKLQIALMIALGVVTSGFVIAISHAAGYVRADAVSAP